MKLKLEIDVDYIEEDGSLDDAIKETIINRIVVATQNKINEKIKEKLSDIVVKTAEEKASNMCDTMVDEFLLKKFNQTDQWGDVIKTDVSVKDLLKEKFDKYWNYETDDRGRGKDGYYSGEVKSRVKWLIDKMIQEHSKEFATTLTCDTENKIKASMKKNLQDKIGAKLVGELGFDKLLLESKK